MRHLYEFRWDTRGGSIFGLFIEDEEVVASHFGKDVCFGEVLGKHSEVSGIFEKEDLRIITSDETLLAAFTKMFGRSYGYDPLQSIEEREAEEADQ